MPSSSTSAASIGSLYPRNGSPAPENWSRKVINGLSRVMINVQFTSSMKSV